MSIRRSIAAAVFVAAVSAPTALGAAPALADTAPTPTGQSQPDVPATDVPAAETPAAETPAPETPAPETPATDPGSGTPAPGGTTPAPGGSSSQELDDLRVRLLRVMAEPGHSRYFQERAGKALDGTVEDIRHFLDVEMPRIIRDDKRIQVLRIIDTAGQGTFIWQAGQKALDGDDAAIDHFLEVEWPELVAKERRGKVLHEMIRPGSTLTLNEAAARALDADELKAFLADLDTIDGTSARIMIAQAMSIGGPEVREAANRVLDSYDPAYLRSFLLTGLGEAQARDTANAKANDANWRKVLQTLIRPGSSLTLTEAAAKALSADDLKAFLAGLDGTDVGEARLRITQAMGLGGPEVRKIANRALDSFDKAYIHSVLLTGLAEAQARDTANAHQPEGGNQGTGTTPEQGGTTVTPVSDTTTTTVTTTDTTTTATGVLASTGVDAPLGAITAAGAASVALGAALVAARRRRQHQS
ncbi:ALF repeat-containing protein [Kitasatospora sp. CB02891]|uniref:ALF repeat-containing protein n=1 Tax=Kitasatospora sp. CB02891 TaxID=2020329 RepID=UPI000C27F0BF|nr:ALF repeat-containing protein [Kitasatospora sp. CB02891]PJN29720.1 hypothetical protein CG736_04135 [Kitasatospora sp. CB02891]